MITKCHLTFLGTGASLGTPVIGCTCEVCQSMNSRNKRFRSSLFLTLGNKHILVDCGPDFKQQALHAHIKELDGIIFTHAHNDHTAGIDELRIFCMRSGKPLPCLLSSETAKDLEKRFYYLFEKKEAYAGLITNFVMQIFENDRGEVIFQGIEIQYFSYYQIGMRVDGLRFGNLAYVSDIKDYPESIFEDLKGVKTLILSALRFQSTPMHFNLDDAIEFAKKVGAEKTWLMHVSHDLDHDTGNAYLPNNMEIAYDDLQLQFEVDIIREL